MEFFKLSPAFKDYLWGGEKLRTKYGKKSDVSPLAESWELSAHKDGQSIIRGGEYDGVALAEYFAKNPQALNLYTILRAKIVFNYKTALVRFRKIIQQVCIGIYSDTIFLTSSIIGLAICPHCIVEFFAVNPSPNILTVYDPVTANIVVGKTTAIECFRYNFMFILACY